MLPKTLKTPFFIGLLFLAACGPKDTRQTAEMAAGLSNYVYAYTSGTISKASQVRVRFTSPIVDADKAGSEVDKGIFQLKPAVAGKAVWEDEQTLAFEPEEMFRSGQEYKGLVDLRKLFGGLPSELQNFEFDFKIKDLFVDLNIDGLQAEDYNDLKRQRLSGTLFTSDMAKDEEVEKALSAKLDGKTLDIEWEHASDQQEHRFSITNIERGEKDEQLVLNWEGAPLGIKDKGEKGVSVPSVSNFKVVDAKVVQEGEQYILVQFSDPLRGNQDLDGLVSLSNYSGRYKFVVDGQLLRIYPTQRVTGEKAVALGTGIKNIEGRGLPQINTWQLAFEDIKPQIRLVGQGVILPNSEGLVFPFEAIGLNAVEVEIHKIFNNNILQFLQTNDLRGYYDMDRVGRIIMQKKVELNALSPNAKTSEWTRYALNLESLIKEDPQAIYQVVIGFRPGYASYSCPGGEEDSSGEEDLELTTSGGDDGENVFQSIWGHYYGIEGYYQGYRWDDRDDPCKPAYYNYDRFVRRNVFASNLGIIAKGGNAGGYVVAVSDIRTTDPLAGVKLEFFDYQKQLLKTINTDGNGLANVELDGSPFVVVASRGDQQGYLKLQDQNALSLSRFDVSGAYTQKGLKGFLYGDRGVWRPGDSIYLNFILEDLESRLPGNHPVAFEVMDPRGQVKAKRTSMDNVNKVYPFHFATSSDAPTGNWLARVSVGGAVFTKTLKIETVKPNRLKINLDFGKEELKASDRQLQGDLQVNWLHGAPAKNVKTRIEMQLKSTKTTFEKFKEYVFDDPGRYLSSEPKVIFEGNVNQDGYAQVATDLGSDKGMAGKMNVNFRARAFEKGGDFSTDQFSMSYSPFSSYAGIFIPKDKYQQKRLEVNKEGKIDFAVVDEDGKALSGKTLDVELYRLSWRWWWDRQEDRISQYNQSSNLNSRQKASIQTNNKGEASWNLTVDDWGRYFVRVCDPESGHCSGDIFYAGYPWYDDEGQNRDAAAMLGFNTDKEKYAVGETIEITVPAGEAGRCLISLESGTKVLETYWRDVKKGENKYSFYATAEMAPTVYAHVSLVQPHGQVQNDLPIRLYGIIPILVEDPGTKIEPVLKMADELAPEKEFKVEVSEKTGHPMAYTIAIVDEGLLDLTRFKTPDPWNAFYAREALGVKTWDLYDQVLGAYGGELERMLSIGGDGDVGKVEKDKAANRFKPVVMHMGPFYLKKGKKGVHEFTMPNYIGSVRAMVVAADEGAYGNAEKTVPVKKPLMVLATLPRTLGLGEQLKLPVSVFAMDSKIKNVTITVEELTGLVDFDGGNEKALSFSRPGDDIVSFDIKTGERVGVAQFVITAKSGSITSRQEIEIDVRNPNPYVTEVTSKTLNQGENWTHAFSPVGAEGTNTAILELSNIPPINLGERLNWLIRYPHGCIEQTTSSAFPQLYVNKLLELDQDKKDKVSRNITAAIDRIREFQTAAGGFSYWPGDDHNSQWGTNYAGHFLLEAQALGYSVPKNVIDRWKKFQKKAAKRWDPTMDGYENNELVQAYRLYSLALAGSPEMGAMNRLRERKNLSNTVKWSLAASYAKAGKTEVAKKIIANVATDVKSYRQLSYTYGSDLRDQAMILETAILLGEKEKAVNLVKAISQQINQTRWYSTQTLAYSLMAIGKFVGDGEVGAKFAFSYEVGGRNKVNAGSSTPIFHIDVPVNDRGENQFMLTNEYDGILFARLILAGQPVVGDQTATSENLLLAVRYTDTQGKDLDVTRLAQGTDFIAEVTVTNPGSLGITYDEMALSQIFPSGWEILNARMANIQGAKSSIPEYQDIRDDRVYTYFDIRKSAKQTYRIQLNAAYQGRYYLPSVYCEAMYDNTINARQPGSWIEVSGPSEI